MPRRMVRRNVSAAFSVDSAVDSSGVPLAFTAVLGYNGSMDSMTTRNVNDIPSAEREVLERLVGRALESHEHVFVMAYTPNAVPDGGVREAARNGLQQTFVAIDRHAQEHGVGPKEADAAIDEAMEQIRPRKP